ncbi:hypothetical protein [Mycobacterium stomatepiae]|uniref:hypothetical protein n=1 Tax=Mycobacterium stomatepiae TaxID=470076 RepID=UPI0013D1BCB5|nr:hypothetical protein [Mycobacterium stomatepiae]MCV7167614.1 hypothetical protein [Mycobacterium stomatepiae]
MAVLGQQRRREVGAFDLKPLLSRRGGAGTEIVEHAPQKQGVPVVVRAGSLPPLRREWLKRRDPHDRATMAVLVLRMDRR